MLREDCDDYFYAEISEINENNCSQWIQENVLPQLKFRDKETFLERKGNSVSIKNKKSEIAAALRTWVKQLKSVEIWADCLAYDWILFCDLFGNAQKIPENINYIPFDIATLLKLNNLNPDLNRVEYVEKKKGKQFIEQLVEKTGGKHNSLFDAFISREVYRK